jgi:hypothetical protein
MPKYFEWQRGFDRSLLLSKIEKSRTIKGGRCSFNSMEYAYWLPVLNSSISACEKVGPLKATSIERAVSDPQERLNNPEAFLDRCQEKFDKLTSAPKQKYVAIFYLTYDGPQLFKEITDHNCRIRWQPNRNSRFYKRAIAARDELSDIFKAKNVTINLNGITALLVHVEAYNREHANEQAGNAIDKVRGLLNLIVNRSRTINPFSRLTTPHAINKFRLGPFRTLHNPNGSLAAKMFWYEPRWSHDIESAKFQGDAKTTNRSILQWWNKTQRNKLVSHISEGLIRYCRALDQHDTAAALLDLWSALEFLTLTQNEKYDVTVSRIIRLFKEHNDARQIATHLKLRRNSTVHAAKNFDSAEADAVVLQAELLVSQILFFCMRYGNSFCNSEELIKFLSLNLDEGTLKRERKIENLFIRYQNR